MTLKNKMIERHPIDGKTEEDILENFEEFYKEEDLFYKEEDLF